MYGSQNKQRERDAKISTSKAKSSFVFTASMFSTETSEKGDGLKMKRAVKAESQRLMDKKRR